MRRSIFCLMLGIFCAAQVVDAISVYLLHDVDRDQIGHLSKAFAGLLIESVVFALLVGEGVALLTSLGGVILHLKGYSPRATLGLHLGIGVTLLQYPWDLIARGVFPRFADCSLTAYLIVAIVFCTSLLLRDSFRQMKLQASFGGSHD